MTVYCQTEKLKDNCLQYHKKETQENYPRFSFSSFFDLKQIAFTLASVHEMILTFVLVQEGKKKEISHTWVSSKDFQNISGNLVTANIIPKKLQK